MEEFAADPVVEPDAARDLLDIAADLFAQIGDFVDEGDLGRQEGVGGVFDQFGGAPAGVEDRRLVEIERPIEIRHHLFGALVRRPHDDAVGMLEVLDRRTLAQEFRIGHHRHIRIRPGLRHDPLHLVAGPDRHGRLGDDDGEPRNRGRDLARRGEDVTEIGMAVAAPRRRADGDEHRFGLGYRPGQVGCEVEALLAHIDGHQPVEVGFEDRNVAVAQAGDLGGVLVDAGDVVTEIGKAGPGHEPDISGADHGDAHENIGPLVKKLVRTAARVIAGSRPVTQVGGGASLPTSCDAAMHGRPVHRRRESPSHLAN